MTGSPVPARASLALWRVLVLISLLPAVAVSAATRPAMVFEVRDGRTVSGWFDLEHSPGGGITVDWGDGTTERLSGRRAYFKKQYDQTAPVRVSVHVMAGTEIRGFYMDEAEADLGMHSADLPRTLKYFHLGGFNTMDGNVADLPRGLQYFVCTGLNTLHGDIADLPRELNLFECGGHNTLHGDIRDLPAGRLAYFTCGGRNTLRGDLACLPYRLEHFSCSGNNTLRGHVENLPRRLTVFRISAGEGLQGHLSGLPRDLTEFYCWGPNTLEGDVATLPRRLREFRIAHGGNRITGNVADLPASLSRLQVDGHNTLAGNLLDLPRGLSMLRIAGRNRLAGNLADLPARINHFHITGDNRIRGYRRGRSWPPVMLEARWSPAEGYGLDTAATDRLLTDLARVSWAGRKRIELPGGNAPPSAAAERAIEALRKQGVRVDIR